MSSPLKEPYKSFVGSISRAVGNDLIDFVDHDDHVTLLMWPPISPDNKTLIKRIAKIMLPGCRVNLNMKSGRVSVFTKG